MTVDKRLKKNIMMKRQIDVGRKDDNFNTG
jgi:hypothetical protein